MLKSRGFLQAICPIRKSNWPGCLQSNSCVHGYRHPGIQDRVGGPDLRADLKSSELHVIQGNRRREILVNGGMNVGP